MIDICCIGHITLDKITTPQSQRFMAGGTSYYFSHAIRSLDVSYQLITALADSEHQFVDDLTTLGIAVTAWPSKHTVYFENSYAADLNQRTQRVLQIADSFTIQQVSQQQAHYFHLGPLLADDIPLGVIKELATRGTVSLDVQGYLRRVDNQQVHAVDWPQKKEVLPYISILKANDQEMATLTGLTDIREGAKMLAGWGVKEVIITLGNKGSVILYNDTFHTIPPYRPSAEVDATGCGDTYMAGYLYQRSKGKDVQAAGEFASAIAGKKVETSGPFRGNENDVLAAMLLVKRRADKD